MKHFKENLPLILLVAIVPYFFYTTPTLSQAIIAGSLAALVGFKFHLEHNALPDYKAEFETQLKERDELVVAEINKLIGELNKVRETQGVINMQERTTQSRESVGW